MNTRICNICKESKELNKDNYHKNKHKAGGFDHQCKKCAGIRRLKESHTKEGVISRIYTAQRNSSRERGHPYPEYTKKELKIALLKNKKFTLLYNNWVKNHYATDDRPSVDRIENTQHYTKNNIQIVTWKENRLKAASDRKAGKDSVTKKVIQLDLKGNFVNKYISQSEAARKLNILPVSISDVCRGKSKQSGGFMWKYG